MRMRSDAPDVKSGGRALGVKAAEIVLFIGFLPSIAAQFACICVRCFVFFPPPHCYVMQDVTLGITLA